MLNTRLRRCIQVIAMDGMYAGFVGAKNGHGAVPLCGALVVTVGIEACRFVGLFAPFGWRHINSVLAIGCEYSVEAREIDPLCRS